MKKIFLLVALLVPLLTQAGSMVQIKRLNQQELLEEATKLGKTTFENGRINVYDINGQLLLQVSLTEQTTIVINNDYVSITDENGQEQEIELVTDLQDPESSIRIYPNPTVDYVFIDGASLGATLRLISLDGQVIKNIVITESHMVLPVSDLANGSYLLQVNQSILKLLKQ